MVTKATTPTITTMTNAPAAKGIGWSKGMASQVSLPNMLVPPPYAQPRSGRRDRAGVGHGDRARSGGQRLIENLLEQPVRDHLERERRRHDALFGELDIAFRRQRRSPGAYLAEPGVKVLRRLRLDLEMHVGESDAAYLSRKAAKGSGLMGGEVELRSHPVHGVDHAAELRDEERGHDAARGQRKADRRAGRDDQPVD